MRVEREQEYFTKDELIQIHRALYLVKQLFEKCNIRHEKFEIYDRVAVKPNCLWVGKVEHVRSIKLLCEAILEIVGEESDLVELIEELKTIKQTK